MQKVKRKCGVDYFFDKLRTFVRANHIQPIIVFSGLSILRKDKPFSIKDRRPLQRATGWDYYEQGRLEKALSSWSDSGGVPPADLLNLVFHVLHKHNVEFMRAPYSAWAQVYTAYVTSKGHKSLNFVYI